LNTAQEALTNKPRKAIEIMPTKRVIPY